MPNGYEDNYYVNEQNHSCLKSAIPIAERTGKFIINTATTEQLSVEDAKLILNEGGCKCVDCDCFKEGPVDGGW